MLRKRMKVLLWEVLDSCPGRKKSNTIFPGRIKYFRNISEQNRTVASFWHERKTSMQTNIAFYMNHMNVISYPTRLTKVSIHIHTYLSPASYLFSLNQYHILSDINKYLNTLQKNINKIYLRTFHHWPL